MSRTIDPTTPVEDLTDDELKYMFARDLVDASVLEDRGLNPYGSQDQDRARVLALQDVAHTGDANTKGIEPDDLVPPDDYEKALKPKKENLTRPQLVGQDDDEDEDEDDEEDDEDGLVDVPENRDYDNWNNDQRRAELADRGLSVEGKKEQLIARLRESDS